MHYFNNDACVHRLRRVTTKIKDAHCKPVYSRHLDAHNVTLVPIAGDPITLDLRWLHSVAGQMASTSYRAPSSHFDVFEGPHPLEMERLHERLWRSLHSSSVQLMEANMLTMALDMISQVWWM